MQTLCVLKELQIGEVFDVIVVGAGPSGVAAATASARSGAKTLLVEKNGFPGGMWTAGLVNPLFDGENKKGIMKEILDKLREKHAWGGFWNISFQYETMKGILDDMLTDSGVTTLYETTVSDVLTENGVITGVVTENRQGSVLYQAARFVDCTGDADIACRAGVKCFLGDDENHACQSMTVMFTIGNVTYLQERADELRILIETAVEKYGLSYRLPFDKPYVILIPETNTAVVQLTHVYNVDPLDPFATSRAATEGRRQAREVFAVMKNYIPEFKDAVLLSTAPMLGVRESRRIDGEYCISTEDCINGVHPEDTIAECTFNIDIHASNSDKQVNIHTQPYGIPYRALIPKGVKNLLVAGKAISGSHEAMASYRVTGNCVAMGEAAGRAAVLSKMQNIDVRAVKITDILPKE